MSLPLSGAAEYPALRRKQSVRPFSPHQAGPVDDFNAQVIEMIERHCSDPESYNTNCVFSLENVTAEHLAVLDPDAIRDATCAFGIIVPCRLSYFEEIRARGLSSEGSM